MKGMRSNNVQPIDFGFLRGLLKDKPTVMPCDIDMIYEINNHYLVGEWKKKYEQISDGQKYALQALAKEPKFTVLIIRGISTGETLAIGNFYKVTIDKNCVKVGFGVDEFKKYVLNWYNEIKG